MLKGFRDFVTGGNLIEVAVGLIMALATFALVQALVADLITPIIAAIVGEPSFGDLAFAINGSEFRYGDFINATITFVSIAAAVYFFVVAPYQAYQRRRGVTPETRLPRVHDRDPRRGQALPELYVPADSSRLSPH
jgi:large conductance mechanosensitive channel